MNVNKAILLKEESKNKILFQKVMLRNLSLSIIKNSVSIGCFLKHGKS